MSLYPKVFRNRKPQPQVEDEPMGELLEDMSYDDLYALAQQEKIGGRSSMTKDQLIKALS